MDIAQLQKEYMFFTDMLKSIEKIKKKTPGNGFAKMKCIEYWSTKPEVKGSNPFRRTNLFSKKVKKVLDICSHNMYNVYVRLRNKEKK